MSLKRFLIRALDSDLGRPLLSCFATAYARHLLKHDVAIGYDTAWWHRVGEYYIPDGPKFGYSKRHLSKWKDEIQKFHADAQDFWFFDYRPKAGDVILDIGAGRGEDSLPFSVAVGSKGKVFAVEAHPDTFNLLRRFCELNKLGNVVPVHAAIAGESGIVYIEGAEHWVASTINTEGSGAPVRAMTLAEFCNEYKIERVDYLKMNIEGAERQALVGIGEVLPLLNDVCICAHDFRADLGHGEQYRSRDFVIDTLTRSGYSVRRRTSDPRPSIRDHIWGKRVAG